MASIGVVPYLFFKGNAKEAMEFYKSVFGGELHVQTMGESPQEMQMPGSKPTDVMHARLSGPVELMASDSQQASDKALKIELSVNGGSADEAKMREMFTKLAEGGKVKMELQKMPWGDLYGQITDKFNIEWMMNIGDSMSS